MRITLPIDKNLDDFHTEVARGLTVGQVISLVLALAALCGCTALLRMAGLPFMACLYISLIPAMIVGFCGMIRPDGMPLPKYIYRLYKINHSKPLVYKTDLGNIEEPQTNVSDYDHMFGGKLIAKLNHADALKDDKEEGSEL